MSDETKPAESTPEVDEPTYLDPDDAYDPIEVDPIPRKKVIAVFAVAVSLFATGAYALASSSPKSTQQTEIRRPIRQQAKTVDPLAAGVESLTREEQEKKLREKAAAEDQAAIAAGEFDPKVLTATAAGDCPYVDCRLRDDAGVPIGDGPVRLSRNGQPVGAYATQTPPGATGRRPEPSPEAEDESAVIPWVLTPPKQEGQQNSTPSGAVGVTPGLPGQDQLAGLQNTINALKTMKAAQDAANGGGQDGDDKKEAFVDQSGIGADISGERDQAVCEVGAGTPIHVSIDQATNSDLPAKGIITATVTKDVLCGAQHQYVAIPQGSTFSGSMDARVTYGQERQLLCMNRLRRSPNARYPNGTKLDVGCLVAADVTGQVGLPATVNNHWTELITGALISALMGTAPSALAGNQTGYAASIPQQLAASAGQNMNQAGQRVVQRELQRKPTLETPMLEFSLVFPNRDIVVEPWDDQPVGARKKRTNKYAGLRW